MTIGEQFKSAIKCKTKEQADQWLKKEVERYRLQYRHSAKKSTAIILSNLGYMAGHYNRKISKHVFKLFGAEHPYFGHPDYWNVLQVRKKVRG
jgi:hypothetical protein